MAALAPLAAAQLQLEAQRVPAPLHPVERQQEVRQLAGKRQEEPQAVERPQVEPQLAVLQLAVLQPAVLQPVEKRRVELRRAGLQQAV